MTDDVTIRPWAPADDAAIVKLQLELQKFEVALHPTRRPWTEAEASEYWRRQKPRLQANEGACLVAEREGEIIGFSIGWVENDIYEMKVHPHEARYAFLSEGYVLPEHRRGKVFTKLVAAMEQHFYGLGIRRIRRGSFATNSGLLDAANKQGYQLYEITLEKVL